MTSVEQIDLRLRYIAAALVLCNDATPGPWRNNGTYGYCVVADAEVGDDRRFKVDDEESVKAYGGHLIGESIKPHNRDFIAASRSGWERSLRNEHALLTWARELVHDPNVDPFFELNFTLEET